MAIDDGLIHSESLLVDAPQSFGDYRPANFDPVFNGPVSAADALRLSLNVPAVDLLDRLGPGRFAARLEHAGLPVELPEGARPNLSIILGGAGVSLEHLVGAFAALNRGGLAGRARFTSSDSRSDRRLLSPGAAWIIRDILERRSEGTSGEGAFDTGSRARVAWKTGTSYGFRDAWALGSTARYTVGVWVGRPDGTPMPGQYGAITALPLMFEVVDSLPRVATGQGKPRAARVGAQEGNLLAAWACPGTAPSPGSVVNHARPGRSGTSCRPPSPSAMRGCGVPANGWCVSTPIPDCGFQRTAHCRMPRARSPSRAGRAWPIRGCAISERRATAIPPLADDCDADSLAAMEVLQIDGPAPDSAIARAPDSPRAPQVRLRALGTNARVRWLVNGELVGESQGGASFVHAFAALGDQRITALADTGAWAELRLRVLR